MRNFFVIHPNKLAYLKDEIRDFQTHSLIGKLKSSKEIADFLGVQFLRVHSCKEDFAMI